MYVGIFLLSAATLALEVALTRVFSLTQWYHFAFMAVAIALLGFGASGSFLSVVRTIRGQRWTRLGAGGFVVATLAAYAATNIIPFDAYRLAIDHVQVLYLGLYILVLTIPFFFSGLALVALLSAHPDRSGAIYGANLAGSGAGCLLALATLNAVAPGNTAFVIAGLGMLALAAFTWQDRPRWRLPIILAVGGLLILLLAPHPPELFDVRLSPYKALSVVTSFQDSRHVLSRWNAFSRIDVVEGPAIHSAPGLSMVFGGQIPSQPALTVDGDNLHTIPLTTPDDPASTYADYLPTAVPFRLRPAARTLILQAGTGLDVLVAWRNGAASVIAVEANPLVVEVTRAMGAPVYGGRTQVVVDSGPSFLARNHNQFDMIIVSLPESFRAVASGDFSLSENYIYTVETIENLYRHLAADGLLVVTRWAQWPPSEDLRAAALVASALRKAGVQDVAGQVVAFRSFQTVTIMARRGRFTLSEIAALRREWDALNYDAVYYPGMSAEDANHFIVLPDTRQHDAFVALLHNMPLPEQPFDISPPSNDRPFFFHLFRWSQMGAIVRSLGKSWQPFGGAGYLVLVVLLIIAAAISIVLILLPLHLRPAPQPARSRQRWLWLVYFGLLGLGFLFVEMPLMQRYILFLSQPVYATAVVLFSLLLSSGAGSMFSARLTQRLARLFVLLPPAVYLYPRLADLLLSLSLSLPLALRLVLGGVSLLPLGFVLGMLFPWGIRRVEMDMPGFAPWAWAANGCASVISSVLAVMIAVSAGFSSVLLIGTVSYLLAVAILLLVGRSCR